MSQSYGGQFAATTKIITLIYYFILLYSRILGAIQQTNSRRGAWSFLRFSCWEKNKLKMVMALEGLSEILASNACASQCELATSYTCRPICREHLNKQSNQIKAASCHTASTKFVFNDYVTPYVYVTMKLTSFTRTCPLYMWAEHGDLFTLQFMPGRAPSIRRWARPG